MAFSKDTKIMTVNSGRRNLLVGSAAATAAAGLGLAPASLLAQESSAQPNAIKQTMNIGSMEVSTLLAGTRTAPDPQSIFGMNVSAEEFSSVSAENFIPADKNQFFFTPTVVRVGDDVTIVVITHMHGDHIGGLSGDDGTPTFPNASYVTGQVEYDAWAKRAPDNFNAKVKPFRRRKPLCLVIGLS